MGKKKSGAQSYNILELEKQRWTETPLWGIALAFLQISFVLLAIPEYIHQNYAFLFSLGHPFYVTLIVSLAFHLSALFWSNFCMFCIYRAKHPFFEQYRIEPEQPFSWEQDSTKWSSLVWRNALVLVFNVIFFLPVIGVLLTPDKKHLMFRYDLESWPSIWEIVWQVVFCSFCEDFMFYCTHRVLHTKWCYKHVHKKHHEYTQPVSIAAQFAHPFETFFEHIIPFYFGLVLLDRRCHFVTMNVWGLYRVMEGGDAHCGYEFPWSPFRLIPFSAPASYHNYHHSHNKGNYATFFCIWDTIFGTNQSYYEYLEKRRRECKQIIE